VVSTGNEAEEAVMNDEYRISQTAAATDETPRDTVRSVLWLVLILSGAANAVLSAVVGNPFVSSAFGAVALVCAGTLIGHHYRNRNAGRPNTR
jgi:uncharacterized membrane protein YjjP (DUF1212 family)